MRWKTDATRDESKHTGGIRTKQKKIRFPLSTESEKGVGGEPRIHGPDVVEQFSERGFGARFARDMPIGIRRKAVRSFGKQRGVFGAIAKELFVTAAKSHLELECALFQQPGERRSHGLR